jgi:hypothetical protein
MLALTYPQGQPEDLGEYPPFALQGNLCNAAKPLQNNNKSLSCPSCYKMGLIFQPNSTYLPLQITALVNGSATKGGGKLDAQAFYDSHPRYMGQAPERTALRRSLGGRALPGGDAGLGAD